MNDLSNLTIAHSVRTWLAITEIWIYNQLNNMENINSIVLSQQLNQPEKFPWPSLYTVSKPQRFLVKAFSRVGFRWTPSTFQRAIDEYPIKILHSHFGNVGWNDVQLASKNNLKHIVSVYGADVNRLPVQRPVWYERYKELFARADLFVCEGPFMAQNLVRLGCPEEKICVQRLGVDVDNIEFVPRKLEANGPLRILIAGTFREKKGIPYALEAIGRLIASGIDIEVTIIGDSAGHEWEEIEKKKILDVISKYSIQSNVRMLGYQPYDQLLAEAYKNHLFISPSVHAADGDAEGGAPVTLIDLMASGMPIISTTHCDIPQIVKHGETGLLAEERDVEGLITHLEWFIANPKEWKSIVLNGRHHIESNFNAKIQAQLQEEMYRNIL